MIRRDASANGKAVIGWREFVGLPDWGIDAIRAKIDTGARTSALHVEDLQLLPDGSVEFSVVVRREPEERRVVHAPLIRVTRIRSSAGVSRERHVVATTLRIGTVDRVVEVGLVSRRRMLCRMLVGRLALGDDFLVDPTARHLLGRGKRSKES